MLVHIHGGGRFATRFHYRPASIVAYIKPTKPDRAAITTWFRGEPRLGDVLVDSDKQWLLVVVSTDQGRRDRSGEARARIVLGQTQTQ